MIHIAVCELEKSDVPLGHITRLQFAVTLHSTNRYPTSRLGHVQRFPDIKLQMICVFVSPVTNGGIPCVVAAWLRSLSRCEAPGLVHVLRQFMNRLGVLPVLTSTFTCAHISKAGKTV